MYAVAIVIRPFHPDVLSGGQGERRTKFEENHPYNASEYLGFIQDFMPILLRVRMTVPIGGVGAGTLPKSDKFVYVENQRMELVVFRKNFVMQEGII